jgi:hypothetical protein
MALKRRWAQWPSRIAEELNGVSGVAGVGGGIMGIGSWTLLGGNMALMLAATGTVITIGAFGYAIYKAVPPLMKRPEDLVGRNVSLDELKDIFPRITSLAIIGPTQAGKTTLKHRLSFDVAPLPVRSRRALTSHRSKLHRPDISRFWMAAESGIRSNSSWPKFANTCVL